MKIVAGRVEVRGKGQRFNHGGVQGVGASFADLHPSVANQETLRCDNEPVLIERVAGNKKVGYSSFIFEGDETMALGCAGPLATDDQSRACDRLTMGNGGEIARPEEGSGRERSERLWCRSRMFPVFRFPRLAKQGHGMRSRCVTLGGIIG